MENIIKIGKPGDVFINREGNECIWIASDGISPLKYRFRLLSEYKMREQEIFGKIISLLHCFVIRMYSTRRKKKSL